MTSQSKHYDGWGNPTQDFYSMRIYYPRNSRGWLAIRDSLPYQYACIPAVEIRFRKECPTDLEIFLVYPGGEKHFYKTVPPRALCALRRAYKGRGGWVGSVMLDGSISLRRIGSAVRIKSPQVGYVS